VKQESPQPHDPPRIPLSIRLLWLIVPSLILIASVAFSIGDDRAVVLPLVNVKLPELCTMYSQFGVDCPGCGLTRSFIHMSAGRIGEAWRLNPAGMLGYIYVVMQIPLALLQLLPNSWLGNLRSSALFSTWGWLNQWLFVALIAAMPAQWIIRMLWKGLL
jgi:hypothetical protein